MRDECLPIIRRQLMVRLQVILQSPQGNKVGMCPLCLDMDVNLEPRCSSGGPNRGGPARRAEREMRYLGLSISTGEFPSLLRQMHQSHMSLSSTE